MKKLFGSIEAGGTKFICAVGDAQLNIVDIIEIPTTLPEETLQKTVDFFHMYQSSLQSIAVGSFGPIDINERSCTYGYITSTPKPGWANTNVIGFLKSYFSLPMIFTTDVNSSAYGEMVLRNNVNHLVYFTIGTGIGGGVVQNQMEIGGIGHTELGHTMLPKHPKDVYFEGVCPFHGACAEGLASGPSIKARYNVEGNQLPDGHEIWNILSYYYAQLAVNATLNYRPEIIVFGGGVMKRTYLIDKVRKDFEKLINGYVTYPKVKDYIVLPKAKNNMSATIGNFDLAKRLIEDI